MAVSAPLSTICGSRESSLDPGRAGPFGASLVALVYLRPWRRNPDEPAIGAHSPAQSLPAGIPHEACVEYAGAHLNRRSPGQMAVS
jgi:hypothetical protein